MSTPVCWHCAGTDRCGCITCLIDTVNGQEPGPCLACKGTRRMNAMRPFLEANNINPGERRWWVLVGHKRNQAAPKLVFIPDQLFDESLKTKGTA